MTHDFFTLGSFIAFSVEMGGIKKPLLLHTMFRAAFFHNEKDRDAFLELCAHLWPEETFFRGTIDGQPAIQHKP